ncbi:dihydrofolate reductase [Serratia sp. M24T3]|uniref:dihydrofolate reductase n=1 Tax=Serratia sp. M24T3 TaxID=932213 RepID=UPI00025B9307|nr:dihydrofolate reductase [Serratia sp. M24T3]EIC85484.1 dihydrofolate reductase [Serratia sp. M24T3]
MTLISMIYATSQDNVLGLKNSIPWHVKGEQERFKAVTNNKLVVVGRQTYEILPCSIPQKDIIVLSSNPLKDTNVRRVSSLEEAIQIAQHEERLELVIAGGAKLFEQAIDICHVIYKSTVLVNAIGDVFGPKIPTSRYKLVWVKNIKESPSYSYQTFVVKELENKKITPDFGLLIL